MEWLQIPAHLWVVSRNCLHSVTVNIRYVMIGIKNLAIPPLVYVSSVWGYVSSCSQTYSQSPHEAGAMATSSSRGCCYITGSSSREYDAIRSEKMTGYFRSAYFRSARRSLADDGWDDSLVTSSLLINWTLNPSTARVGQRSTGARYRWSWFQSPASVSLSAHLPACLPICLPV